MSTLYLKITDAKGDSHIEVREAWDNERFIASITKQYAEDKINPSRVEVVTREDWIRSIRRK